MSRERPVYLGCDIDMTLQAGDWFPKEQPVADQALAALVRAIKNERHARPDVPFYFGTVTGRTLESHRQEVEERSPTFKRSVEEMNLLIGSVGAEMALRRGNGFEPVAEWPGRLAKWDREKARGLLLPLEQTGELTLQEAMAQSGNKLSFFVDAPRRLHERYAERIRGMLGAEGVEATVIFSGGRYLDVLPRLADRQPVNKGTALQQGAVLLAEQDSLAETPQIIFAGDSENDEDGFEAAVESGGFGVVPANAKDAFKDKMRRRYPESRLYVARRAKFGAAILEALEARGVIE